MRKSDHPQWDVVRNIVRNWLASNTVTPSQLAARSELNRSVVTRFLGKETTLDASNALKLYNALRDGLDLVSRRQFLDAAGLLPLAAVLGQDALLLAAVPSPTSPPQTSSYPFGLWLVSAGCDAERRGAWEEAYSLLLEAEQVFIMTAAHVPHTPCRIQAAQAACKAVQQLLNLGNLNRAEQDLFRIQQTYLVILEPETMAEVYRLWGWLDFCRGRYVQASKWFSDRLTIVEKLGDEGSGHHSYHFLARISAHQAQLSIKKHERDKLFRSAELHYDKSHQAIVSGSLPEIMIAIDLFRRSELLHIQGKSQEAEQARKKVRVMFGQEPFPHVDIAEARVALNEGDTRHAKTMALAALEVFVPCKFAKGIADALKVLAQSEYQEGKANRALEFLSAALCVYPYDEYLSSRHAWQLATDIKADIIREEGRSEYNTLLKRLHILAQEQTGAFAYLHYVAADRGDDITSVMNRLGDEGQRVS